MKTAGASFAALRACCKASVALVRPALTAAAASQREGSMPRAILFRFIWDAGWAGPKGNANGLAATDEQIANPAASKVSQQADVV
jgi:hypothetical protein